MKENRSGSAFGKASLYAFSLAMTSALLTPQVAKAQNINQLLNMDLADLMLVSVASKKEETIQHAPSIINVVTADDISRYGAINLHDVFNRIPSMAAYASIFQNNAVSIRGQSNQHYPNRILFMLNGHPMRESWAGGYTTMFFTNFPVTAVKKIEVIRGPGSVLYGTNAFSGVVNIITKDQPTDYKVEATTIFGTDGRFDVESHGSQQFKDGQVFIAAKHSYLDGLSRDFTDEGSTSGQYEYDEKGYSYLINGRYKDFEFNLLQSRNNDLYHGGAFTLPSGQLASRRSVAGLKHKYELNEKWVWNNQVTFNTFFNDRNNKDTSGRSNKSKDLLIESNIRGTLNDRWSILFGTSLENHDGDIVDVNYHTQWYGGFAQAEYSPTTDLTFTAGAQVNKPKNVSADISPRLSVVKQWDKKWSSKLLYGQAFRSPYAIETAFFLPGILQGNPDVKPETIETTEAQVSYNDDARGFNAALTLYHSKIDDIIGRQAAIPTPQIANLGSEKSYGIEFEAKKDFGNGWITEGSLIYQESESNTGVDNPNLAPNLTAKLGVSYAADAGWRFGIFDVYTAAADAVRNVNPAVLEVNPQADHHHIISANIDFDIPRLMNKEGTMPDMKFSLFGENLLDRNVYIPESNRRIINTIPNDTRRAIYGRLTIRF